MSGGTWEPAGGLEALCGLRRETPLEEEHADAGERAVNKRNHLKESKTPITTLGNRRES
jgi:hypothetical protein